MFDASSVNCIIYHADCTDGFGAAYAAWKCLGNRSEYYPCKHGTLPPDIRGKTVAILDFSFNNATTKQMIEDADGLIIIDHGLFVINFEIRKLISKFNAFRSKW